MAITSCAWIALAAATPITPVRYGSSEKYSKARPAIVVRCRHTPGPSRTCWPSVAVSDPMMSPGVRQVGVEPSGEADGHREGGGGRARGTVAHADTHRAVGDPEPGDAQLVDRF